jgi:hypothetical protein
MRHKKLTPTEIKIINYYVIHRDRLKAYKLGMPQAAKWLRKTVAAKAEAFFNDPRIQYYRGFQDGGIKVVDDGEVYSETEMIDEAAKVPAVGGHHGGGQPSLYRPEYPQIMIDFFNIPPFSIEERVNEKTGEVTRDAVTNALPTKAGFAAHLRISPQTLDAWATKVDVNGDLVYPDFAEAYKIIDAMIENVLVTNTLMGKYQASFAQFYAKNKLGYKDKSDLVLEGGSKPVVTIGANMTAEEAAIIYKEALGQKD